MLEEAVEIIRLLWKGGEQTYSDRNSLRITRAWTLSLACGLVLGLVGVVWSQHGGCGVVIGAAMTCSTLTAGLMRTIIPLFSKRLGFDPAATAGPFETASQDVIGFAVFL